MAHTKPAKRSGLLDSQGTERVAAVLALLALAGAVVVLLAGTIRNWVAVLVALAGLVVTVVAGWDVVSRRGAVRAVALVFAVAAMALIVWGLAIADLWLPRVVLTLALAAVSVGCARMALRRTRRARRAKMRAAPVTLRPSHPVLLMNPKSGGGKAERFHLPDECRARGIEPIVLQPGDDLVQLAEDAIARGADVIGMAGGDGSQALVATVAARHGIPHVVVPAGTRNHFALDLGLDRADVMGALDAFGEAVERRVDLAEVNGRIFVNNASLGLYAKIVQTPEYRDAKLKTAADLLPGLLGPEAEPLDLRFAGPNATEYATAHLILVSNNPYQLDHIGGRGARERIDAGTLGLVAARISGPGEAWRFVTLEAAGQVRRFEGWLEWESPQFQVDSGAPVEIGIDGEALVMDPPLVFSSRPGALVVRLPRSAPGVSPAAAAIHLASVSTIAALAATVAGKDHRSAAGLPAAGEGVVLIRSEWCHAPGRPWPHLAG
jgi:diacylglycerol kinase family enzyme